MKSLRQIAVTTVSGLVLGLGVIGCAHEEPDNLPGTAEEVVSGNNQLRYTAPYDGQVYVFDTITNKSLYVGKVDKGQNVYVDQQTNRISLDGQTISQVDLGGAHKLKVFFDRGNTSVSRTTIETTHSEK